MDKNKYNIIISDYLSRYELFPLQSTYAQIYEDLIQDKRFARLFAIMHQNLNQLLGFMNNKSKGNSHYNAEESRELLSVIETLDELKQYFKNTEYNFFLADSYQVKLDECKKFLANSGGSAIPDDFQMITLNNYDPIFFLMNNAITIPNAINHTKLILIGEGAFAFVHKYKDEFYDTTFAKKSLKPQTTVREKERFLKEYEIMKKMKFPYILEVYNLLKDQNSYLMEYCSNNLDNYITKGNNTLKFSTRKKIALQFLYAVNYVHSKKLFHRDISFKNILIKEYDSGAVTLKLSDFGLVKVLGSNFTKSDSEYKGTIVDPAIDPVKDKFKNYSIKQEVYPIGVVLQFIFTGRKSIEINQVPKFLKPIIQKCTSNDLTSRYENVKQIIEDVEVLNSLE